MTVSALDDIQRIVARIAGRDRVTPKMLLLHDLGITGDDASELLDEVQGRFGTSFASFPFSDYFTDEPDLLSALLRGLGRRGSEKPLTVQHLADVVSRGAWFDPPLEG